MKAVTGTHQFKRLVLGLLPGLEGHVTQAAAELATMLQVELLGLFLDDPNLQNLAALPFAREFRPLGAGWHAIQPDQLSRDLDIAVRKAEHALTSAARGVLKGFRFEVLRGPIPETIPAISLATDIVMVVEPLSAAARATAQFASLTEAAFRSPAAVIVSPPRVARLSGPVVAIALTPEDASIRAAATIAKAVGEELIILQALENDQQKPSSAGSAFARSPNYARALEPVAERLIVMSRSGTARRLAPSTAALRGIPVLVLEPEDTAEQAATEC
jgi:hypothetical protein